MSHAKKCCALVVAFALASATSARSGGGVSSDNVDWIAHVAQSVGAAKGGRPARSTCFMTNDEQGLIA